MERQLIHLGMFIPVLDINDALLSVGPQKRLIVALCDVCDVAVCDGGDGCDLAYSSALLATLSSS